MDGFSQAAGREPMQYFDQHGREWVASGDVKAKLHPCSPLRPNFRAPWYPPTSIAHFKFGLKNPTQFRIDYDGMLADARLALALRKELLFQAASHFNVPNYDPDTTPATAQMLRDVGPEAPSIVDLVRACKAANGFILGSRPFDPNKPGDVKLNDAIQALEVKRGSGDDNPDEFSDDEFAEEVEAPRKRGRPTNAERAARAAEAEV